MVMSQRTTCGGHIHLMVMQHLTWMGGPALHATGIGNSHPHSLILMVVADFHFIGIPVFESKTDAALVIYPDRVLALALIKQGVQAVVGKNFQVFQPPRQIDVFELPRAALWHRLPAIVMCLSWKCISHSPALRSRCLESKLQRKISEQ